jgi:NAD(P)-dependent dehydrogenase (short-subunit alcohol dehydrogenase family)
MTRFAGQRVLVTGATSGIGAATARAFAAEGARVMTLTDAPAEAIDAAIGEGWLAAGECVDISDQPAVAQAIGRLAARAGPAEILVNNAAIWASNPVPGAPVGLFDRIVDVTLKGSFYVTHAAVPAMIAAGRGAVVFVGSVSGVAGRAGDSAYSAAKAGVAMLARTLGAELGASGVRVNCVCPGAVATPMTAVLRTPEGEAAIEALMARHPSPRRSFFMGPEQIASVILFLASDAASALNGAVIAADEGLTATM